MDPTVTEPGSPSIDVAKASAPSDASQDDPLVKTWISRIKEAEKHWDKLHKRMRHNRKLARGIDDEKEATDPKWNKQRANLIQSTLVVVLSKVYAKNPEMSAAPVNKARSLRLFADTVSGVTQAMLEDAKLKKKGKAMVRAAMTCGFGISKLQYQRVTAGERDPIIRQRIADSQDNIKHLEGLIAQCEDEQQRCDHETKKREIEEAMKGLQAQSEVIAAEGLVLDRVSSDRLLVDPAVEDIWEYESAGWLVEKIPMRKSAVKGMCPDMDLSTATTFKVGEIGKDFGERRQMYSPGQATSSTDDPILMVYEAWSRLDCRIYTIVDGCNKQFAVEPYTPTLTGERWYPYFILPFQSVDGEFAAQSLVDLLERLQEEHNETRDKFAEVRRNIRPHFIINGDVKDKDITIRLHPELGEIIVVNGDGPLKDNMQEGAQLRIDPAVYDTSPIRNDWEMVSGLQDAARSVVVQPKTATEASISDQSLAARVSEFRDQIEDCLTEIAQTASELCLLAMTPAQVETIMGAPTEPDPEEVAGYEQQAVMAAATGQMPPPPPAPTPTYEWPAERTPDTVFNLVQIKIRAGSTAAPNKLEMQENWSKALGVLQPMVNTIRQIEAMGGDATPEREMVKETAARFDETIDVERFLPPKPTAPAMPALPGPGMGGGINAPQPTVPMEPAGVMPGGHLAQTPIQ